MIELGFQAVVLILGTVILVRVVVFIYRLVLHPLSNIPGPTFWATSTIPYTWSLCRGSLVKDVCAIHRNYGDLVRIAPDEVSCASGDGWQIVHGHNAGHQDFPLDPRWFSKPPHEAISIRTAHNPKDHSRIRRVMQRSFTEKALVSNEAIVQQYVNEFIACLKRACLNDEARGAAEVNMVDYFNFVTFDIIGDLCFAEPFHCLSTSTYHPWVASIYKHLQASTYLGATRLYPRLSRVLMKFIPTSVLEGQKHHRQATIEKVYKRMNLEQQRADFMSEIMSRQGKNGLSDPEIESNFHVLLTAGTETTSLVLSGIMHYLLRDPIRLAHLTTEVRDKFKEASEISFTAVEHLKYLNAVIHEGLRMCPPHPQGNPRVVPSNGETVGGHQLPGGTHIAMHQWALFRKPEYFHEADMFIPERWLQSAYAPDSPYFHDRRADVMVFGIGPRRCIGQQLAWSEMRIIFAKLVWSFDVSSIADDSMRWEDQKTYFMVRREPIRAMLRLVRH